MLPLLEAFPKRRSGSVLNAINGRPESPLAIHNLVGKAAVPALAGHKRDLEAQAAIGINDRGAIVVRPDGQAAGKILVAISYDKPRAIAQPVRRDVPAADNMLRLDLKNIGEIASDRDF